MYTIRVFENMRHSGMVQTIKQEVLDYFVVFGHKHMDYLCDQFRVHYHLERPHQGLDNQLIEKPMQNANTTGESIPIAEIHCQERLGGLLKSYSRKAA
jgi:putative transposase